MLNEKKIQEGLDRRLSGLSASVQRRMRIQAAVNAERQENTPMKRKISTALIFALVLVLLTASLAIADSLNLFSLFGEKDERYAAVAPEATLSLTQPAQLAHPHLGQVKASIDSAYFDGLSLHLAYRIENPRFAEVYTPTEAEKAAMKKMDALPRALDQNEPGQEIFQAYNEALEQNTPFGYRQFSVYPSDHTVTDDGIDIEMYSSWSDYDENGALYSMLEFETPLTNALRGRKELQVSIRLYQQESVIWFDGKECYTLSQRSEIGQMNAVIPLTPGAAQSMAGAGRLGGVNCTASAEVSKMAAAITLRSESPLSAFLAAPPQGMEELDTWVEIIAQDEQGALLLPHGGLPLDDSTEAVMTFQGTGQLPKILKLYVYTAWEGMDSPDLSALEAIELTISK